MSRALATDFMQSMRFWVDVVQPDTELKLGTPEAGFSNVSTPEESVEAVEYREGTYIYTRKYSGIPSMGDITMSRGATKGDSTFLNWLRRASRGGGEYRIDFLIYHGTRAVMNGAQVDRAKVDETRIYKVQEALPTRHKVAGDLDGTAGDVSIMELDCAYESFEVGIGVVPG